MRHVSLGIAVLLAIAPSAFAHETGSAALADRVTRVEQQLATQAAPSSREIQSSVDAYLASGSADASLVGGPGQAGYDGGFWIRGGSFLLRINLTLQARYEYFDWDKKEWEPSPGGDLSGFSLPRATLKLSGDATCGVHYYAELEFGHSGIDDVGKSRGSHLIESSLDDVALREGWIEYEASGALAFRMGIVRTAATRQLMTAPELQQFVDISMASAFIGSTMPGWTDRNRDYGVMIHGAFGCDQQLSYMMTVTNGDGVVHRNVLDGETSDNLAYSARVNWDIKGHMGYEEGALRQTSCGFVAAVGAWVHYYADHARENPYLKFADRLTWGVDLALGWGGFSLTAAYSAVDWGNGDVVDDVTMSCWLAQVGFLIPGTAWEIAARYSTFLDEEEFDDLGQSEIAGAVTYYIDGHADKVTADVAWITNDEGRSNFSDVYPAYNRLGESDGLLLRFQWQLAL